MGSDKEKDGKDKIPVSDPGVLSSEFASLLAVLSKTETEDTWLTHDAALHRLTALVRGGACKSPLSTPFLAHFKEPQVVEKVCIALASERTRLSATALEVLSATARLGPLWESLIPLYIPSVVKLLGRANKLYVTRASGTLRSLIRNTRCSGLVAVLAPGIDSPSLTVRLGCAEAVLCCLGGTPEKDTAGSEEWEKVAREGLGVEKGGLDKKNGLALGPNGIEGLVKKGGADRDPKVRSMCKRVWEIYRREWPDRAAAFAKPLTPTVRRVLAIGKDDPLLLAPSGPSASTSGSSRAFSSSISNSRSVGTKSMVHPLSKSMSSAPSKPTHPPKTMAPPPVPASSAAAVVAAPKARLEPAAAPAASSSSSKAPRPVRPALASSTGSSRTAGRAGGAAVLGVSTSSSSAGPEAAHPLKKPASSVSLRAVSAPVGSSSGTTRPGGVAFGVGPSRAAARREPVGAPAAASTDPAHRPPARSVLRDGAGPARSTSGWKPMRRAETPSTTTAAPGALAPAPAHAKVVEAPASEPEKRIVAPVSASSAPSVTAPPLSSVVTTAAPVPASAPIAQPDLLSSVGPMVLSPFRPTTASQAVQAHSAPIHAPAQPVLSAEPPALPPSKASSGGSTSSSTHTIIVKPAPPPARPAPAARPPSNLGASTKAASSAAALRASAGPGGAPAAVRKQPFKPTRATSSTQASAARAVSREHALPKPGRAPSKSAAPVVAPTEKKAGKAPVQLPDVVKAVERPAPEESAVVEAPGAEEPASGPPVAFADAAPTPADPTMDVAVPGVARSPSPPPAAERVDSEPVVEQAVLSAHDHTAAPVMAETVDIPAPSPASTRVEPTPARTRMEPTPTPFKPAPVEEQVPLPPASPAPAPILQTPAPEEESLATSSHVLHDRVVSTQEEEDEVLLVGDAPSADGPSTQLSRATSVPSLLDTTIAPASIDESGGEAPRYLGVSLITPISPVPRAPASLPPSVSREAATTAPAVLAPAIAKALEATVAQVVPRADADGSDLLVDFEHEDTVWMPRAPSLHDDLVGLAASVPLPPTPPGSSQSQRRTSAVASFADDSLAQFDLAVAAGDATELDMEEEPDRTAIGDASLGGLLSGLVFPNGFDRQLRQARPVLPDCLLDEDETAPIVNPASTDSTTNYDRSLLSAWGGDDTVDDGRVAANLPERAAAETEDEEADRSSTPVPCPPVGRPESAARTPQPENVDAEAVPPLRRSLRNRGPAKEVVTEEPKTRSRAATRTRAALVEIQ